MDEILVANFMLFLDVVREENYDLWIGDEAWEVGYCLHENPELKTAAYVWLTDFVGWLPMEDGGGHEAFLAADYNAEMIEHIARYPRIRDRAVFVGNPRTSCPTRSGPGSRGSATGPAHYDIPPGYVTGFEPVAATDELRAQLGYAPTEQVCVVTVRGSGVGGHLLRRVIDAFPRKEKYVPGLRMVVVAGPRIDPATLPETAGSSSTCVLTSTGTGRVRPRRRPGRPDDLDGAHCETAAVPVLPPPPLLRAELPRPPQARALRGRPGNGLRDREAPPRSRPRSPRRSAASSSPPRRDRRRRPAPRMIAELL